MNLSPSDFVGTTCISVLTDVLKTIADSIHFATKLFHNASYELVAIRANDHIHHSVLVSFFSLRLMNHLHFEIWTSTANSWADALA